MCVISGVLVNCEHCVIDTDLEAPVSLRVQSSCQRYLNTCENVHSVSHGLVLHGRLLQSVQVQELRALQHGYDTDIGVSQIKVLQHCMLSDCRYRVTKGACILILMNLFKIYTTVHIRSCHLHYLFIVCVKPIYAVYVTLGLVWNLWKESPVSAL